LLQVDYMIRRLGRLKKREKEKKAKQISLQSMMLATRSPPLSPRQFSRVATWIKGLEAARSAEAKQHSKVYDAGGFELVRNGNKRHSPVHVAPTPVDFDTYLLYRRRILAIPRGEQVQVPTRFREHLETWQPVDVDPNLQWIRQHLKADDGYIDQSAVVYVHPHSPSRLIFVWKTLVFHGDNEISPSLRKAFDKASRAFKLEPDMPSQSPAVLNTAPNQDARSRRQERSDNTHRAAVADQFLEQEHAAT
jgi:hypothetical protein